MHTIIYLENCFSTNDEIANHLSEESNIAVYTFNQTKGRGQYGNSWISKPYLNLAYSFGIKSSEIKFSDISLNYYTAIIVRDYIAKVTNLNCKIKWPNDIILDDKKVCGILIEKKKINRLEYYIIGVGINVMQENFEDITKAGSLLSASTSQLDLQKFTEDFHDFFSKAIHQLQSDDEILNLYNKHLYKKDQIAVFEIGDIRQNGIIKNTDKNGYLWVELENDGLKKFFHKEIAMLY